MNRNVYESTHTHYGDVYGDGGWNGDGRNDHC